MTPVAPFAPRISSERLSDTLAPRDVLAIALDPELNPVVAPEQMSELTLAPSLAPASRIDLERSRRLYRRVVREQEDRQCFDNAARASWYVPESVYVEGYAVSHALCVLLEHAWLELPDGAILDPALAFSGRDAGKWTYFPAFRWSTRDVARMFLASPGGDLRLPLQALLPMAGRRYAGWRNAVISAHRHRAALYLQTFGTLPYSAGTSDEDCLRALVGAYWLERSE